MRSLIFASLFVLLFFSLHYLFYSRVIKKLLVPEKAKKILTTLLGLNFLCNILYIPGRYSDMLPGTLYYLFSLSFGVTFVLLLYLIIHEILNLTHKALYKVDPARRAFLKKSSDGALMALATSYVAIGAYEGSKAPVVHVVRLGTFDFSIVQISDLHIGGLIDRAFVRTAVEKINALHPDIVCITGDVVDTSLESIQDALLELEHIEAAHGVYFILGNHEYFHDPEKIIAFMQEMKLTLLLNQHVELDALKVNIVGITDRAGYRREHLAPDIDQAFKGINPEYKTILLAHQPKSIEMLGDHTPDLILSGHTHGGQIWPFGYLVRRQQPYVKGLHKLPYGGYIYVNSGIGFWGPPMRLGSEAEIAYIL